MGAITDRTHMMSSLMPAWCWQMRRDDWESDRDRRCLADLGKRCMEVRVLVLRAAAVCGAAR
jgi:hypothetical protein